jgi:hypothetical protein
MKSYHFHAVARILATAMCLPVITLSAILAVRSMRSGAVGDALMATCLFILLLAVQVVLIFFTAKLHEEALEGTVLGQRLWLIPYAGIVSVKRARHPTFVLMPVDMIEYRRGNQIARFPLLVVNRNEQFLSELRALVEKAASR